MLLHSIAIAPLSFRQCTAFGLPSPSRFAVKFWVGMCRIHRRSGYYTENYSTDAAAMFLLCPLTPQDPGVATWLCAIESRCNLELGEGRMFWSTKILPRVMLCNCISCVYFQEHHHINIAYKYCL